MEGKGNKCHIKKSKNVRIGNFDTYSEEVYGMAHMA